MKVSWIDPDTFRSLADSLLDEDQRQSSQESAHQAATQAAAHLQAQALAARLEAMSMMDHSPSDDLEEEDGELEAFQSQQETWDEEEDPQAPPQEELQEIRKHLEGIRDRARQSGLFKAFQDEAPLEDSQDLEEVDQIAPEDEPPVAAEISEPSPVAAEVIEEPSAVAEMSEPKSAAAEMSEQPPTPSVELSDSPLAASAVVESAESLPIAENSFQAAAPLSELPLAQESLSLLALRQRLAAPSETPELPVETPAALSPSEVISEASLQLPEFPQDLSQFAPEPTPLAPAAIPRAIPPLSFDSMLPPPANDEAEDAEKFVPITGTLQERLGHFATWASHLTGAHDVVVVDQHGDLLWGEGRCSDLVASALLAVHTEWRKSPVNLAQRHPHLDSPLGDKKVLSLLPCSTRYGQVTLGLVLGQALAPELAHELGDGLLATIEHES